MRNAAILLVLACALLRGQAETKLDAGAPGAPLPSLTFPATDAVDRRENLARIQELLLFQNQAQQQRLKEANGIYAAMGRLAKITDVEPCILAGMAIQRDLVVALDGIREDRSRCLTILERIDEASHARDLSAEVERYLRGARVAATNAMRFQLVQRKRLENLGAALRARLQSLPPPATFDSPAGIPMVLVQRNDLSFYISRAPIPPATVAKAFGDGEAEPTAVNWHQATGFCQWLTRTHSAPYALPTLAQMKAYAESGGTVPKPVWTRDIHAPKELKERDLRDRFGVELVMLFDPNRVLDDPTEREEVPFAMYPEVSFFVVTPAETGWWFRWHALKQTLDN